MSVHEVVVGGVQQLSTQLKQVFAMVDHAAHHVDAVCALVCHGRKGGWRHILSAGAVHVKDVGRKHGGQVGAVHHVARNGITSLRDDVCCVLRHSGEEGQQGTQRVSI